VPLLSRPHISRLHWTLHSQERGPGSKQLMIAPGWSTSLHSARMWMIWRRRSAPGAILRSAALRRA
jgi:hypothetical protein